MSGTIFMETLRRNWRAAVYWGLGIASYAVLIILLIPNVDMLKSYADLVSKMPAGMLKMIGASDASAIATPEGFLGFGFFTYTVMMLAVYAVVGGLGITANEEDQGILDLVISLPVPRWRIIVERLAAYTVFVVVILVMCFVGLWLGVQITASNPDAPFKIDMVKLLEGSLNLFPGTMLMLVFTAFVAAVVRHKGLATGITALVIIASYLLNFLGGSAKDTVAGQLNRLSLFSYIDSANVIQNGLVWGNILLLLMVTALLWIGSVWFFQRRDVGV
ncbi:MAG: ABC transporter permease subunit [Chloroflexota bacterium]